MSVENPFTKDQKREDDSFYDEKGAEAKEHYPADSNVVPTEEGKLMDDSRADIVEDKSFKEKYGPSPIRPRAIRRGITEKRIVIQCSLLKCCLCTLVFLVLVVLLCLAVGASRARANR